MSAAARPTVRVIGAAYRISDQTSRPDSSVPSQCELDGPCRFSAADRRERARRVRILRCEQVPEDRHEQEQQQQADADLSAARAHHRVRDVAPAPGGALALAADAAGDLGRILGQHAHSARTLGSRRGYSRSASEVRDDDHRGRHQEDALQHREVLVLDRLDRREPDTGPREECLDGDRAAEQEPEVERDLRDDRQSRGGHDVAPPHRQRAKPDGARRHDVVGVHGRPRPRRV